MAQTLYIFSIIYYSFYLSYANAIPSFEGRGGEKLVSEISGMLTRTYACVSALDYSSFSVLPGQECWLCFQMLLYLYL